MADQNIINLIASIGRRRHVSPMELKSAYETGLVESGLQNLSGGTGDSAGWRQERASLYPNPTNLQASINRYFDETGALKGKYSRAGDLAAAVQRPRADLRGKYQARSADADSLLARLGGGTSTGGSTGDVSASVPQSQSPFDPGAQAAPSLAGLLTQPQQPPVQVPVAPHAAIQSPVVSQAPQDPGISGLLQAIQTPSQGLPEVQGASSVKVSGGGPTASAASVASGNYPTGRTGKIIGTPYAGTHTLGNWQSDRAVDIAVPKGTPMVALQDGTVVKVSKHPQGAGRFAGDQITIRGANGNEYFYAHGVASVQAGERIRKGQQLGVTGSANGVNHLHFAQKQGDPFMHVGGRR